MGRTIVCLMISIVGGLLPAVGAVAEKKAWHGLASGPHQIGFRRAGERRTIALWYPAASGGTAMTLGHYFGSAAAKEFRQSLAAAGIPESRTDAAMTSPMTARAGAAARSGSFPVVVLGQGNAQDTPDQAILAEHLASHGYVVVSTPSPTIKSPMRSEDEVGVVADRQASEMRAALSVAARALPGADLRRIGAVGHSFGARAALLLAMQDPRVRAVVSLDGGIGTAVGVTSMRAAPSFDAHRATAPILHFYSGLDTTSPPDLPLLQGVPADLTLRKADGMRHVHFTTLGFLAVLSPEIGALTKAGPGLQTSLVDVARSTREFLDHHIHARPGNSSRRLPDTPAAASATTTKRGSSSGRSSSASAAPTTTRPCARISSGPPACLETRTQGWLTSVGKSGGAAGASAEVQYYPGLDCLIVVPSNYDGAAPVIERHLRELMVESSR